MQGLVFDIRRYSVHDGPGIRTTVFLKGCPLRCLWCHNPESWLLQPETTVRKNHIGNDTFETTEVVGKYYTPMELVSIVEKDYLFFDESNGGVTFSGGEPLMQPEFLEQSLALLHKKGIHTAVDTCGLASAERYKAIAPHTNLFLFDLKHMDSATHKRLTGCDNELILSNLRLLSTLGANIIIRYPFIPTANDSKENLNAMVSFLSALKGISEVDVLPYHKIAAHKYQKMGIGNWDNAPSEPTRAEIEQVVSFLKNSGYKVKVGG